MRRYLTNPNIKNSLWNLTDIFLYPALFFLTVSLFIERLGATGFGIWMLVNTIIVCMQVFSFGIGPGVLKNISYYIGRKEKEQINAVMNNAISLTLLLFLFSILCTLVLAIAVYHGYLLNVNEAGRALSAQCIFLSGGIIGFRFIEQVFTNYYKAREQFRAATLISTGNRLLPLLINILLLCYTEAAIQHLLITIIGINMVILALGYGRIRKELRPFPFRFSWQSRVKLTRYAMILWFQSLAMILVFQTDRYLVVHFFSLSVLSYYALTATIFNHLHMGFHATLGWVAPKFTKRYASGQETESLYFAAQYLVVAIATIALLLLYFLYPYVFTWILGRETMLQTGAYVPLFIVFELFFVVSIIPAYYFNAVGKERSYLYFVLYYTATTIMAMLLFAYRIREPQAVLYGLVVSCALAMPVQHIMAEKVLFSKQAYWRRPLKLLLPPALAATFMLCAGTVYGWLALGGSCFFLYYNLIRGNTHSFKQLFRS